MVRRHFPDMADKISTTVSPMCAVSRMIKAKEPDAVTVFVGPCVAKKSEVVDQKIEGNADYVLTYSEIRAIMSAKNVELQPMILLIRSHPSTASVSVIPVVLRLPLLRV